MLERACILLHKNDDDKNVKQYQSIDMPTQAQIDARVARAKRGNQQRTSEKKEGTTTQKKVQKSDVIYTTSATTRTNSAKDECVQECIELRFLWRKTGKPIFTFKWKLREKKK